MKIIHRLFGIGYIAIVLLLVCCALALVLYGALELWQGVVPNNTLGIRERFHSILECIGLVTIAVVCLELAQTVLEEEVQREVKVSAPTRVRRFLSRFMVVLIVALAIETLVLVFEVGASDTGRLVHVAWVGLATGVLLAAWGVFIKCNRSAEELEPEAMAKTKREDKKLD